MTSDSLERRLQKAQPLLLDGAMGTLLEARGVECRAPIWSAQATLEQPEQVASLHREYAEAGVEVLTANTFRTHRRNLEAAGRPESPGALTHRAVAAAKHAARAACAATASVDGSEAWVAGSLAPLEDCYRPDRVPDDVSLAREHTEQATALCEAGCDLILAETHNAVREAVAATRAARATGLPVWTTFVCGANARLLSGEALADAIVAVAEEGASAVGVNCLALDHCGPAVAVLVASGHPFGVSPNLLFDPSQPQNPDRECAPDHFIREAIAWRAAGARFVGACCGSRPTHLAMLRRVLFSPS